MKFIPSDSFYPSVLAYGDGAVTPEPGLPTPTVPEADLEAEDPQQGTKPIDQYVGLGLQIFRGLFGHDDARLAEASLEGKLANAQAQYKVAPPSPLGLPLPGTKNFYANEIRKFEAQLKAARESAAAARKVARIQSLSQIGMTLGIFAGVVVVGGMAVNQIQRARLHQAELDRLRR